MPEDINQGRVPQDEPSTLEQIKFKIQNPLTDMPTTQQEPSPAPVVNQPIDPTTNLGDQNDTNARNLMAATSHLNVGRDPDANSTVDAPTFLQSTWWNMQDDGFTANAARILGDLDNEPETQTTRDQLQDALPGLMMRLPNGGAGLEQEVLNNGTLEAATDWIDRYNRVTTHQRYQQNEGIIQGLGAGVAGFVADPTNMFIALKGAQVAATVVPKLTATMGKTAANILGIGAGAAMEEAIRNVPRLGNDPTYNQEQYITTVAMSAAFGSGMMSVFPTARFAYGKAQPHLDNIGKVMSDSLHQYKLDVSARTVANTATELAYQGSKTFTKEAVEKLDVKATVRAARTKAQKQIDSKLREVDVEGLKTKINDIAEKGTYDEVVKEVGDSLGTVVEALRKRIPEVDLAEFDKAARNIVAAAQKFEAETRPGAIVDKVANIKVGDQGKSGGAAHRQTTVGDVVGDQVHDIQTAFKDLVRLADEVDNLSDAATKLGDTAAVTTARNSMLSIVESANSALQDIAARKGTTINRKRIDAPELKQRGAQRFRDVLTGDSATNLRASLLKHGITDDIIGHTVREVLRDYNIKGDSLSEAITEHILGGTSAKWDTPHKLNKLDSVRSAIRSKLFKEYYRLDVVTSATGEAKKELNDALFAQMNDIDAVFDWYGIMATSPFEDLNNMSPKWAQVAAGHEEGLGADRFAIHDQYNSPAQLAVSNSLGKLTESLSSQLIRSKVSLAEWFTMNVLEMPTGTGGIVTRADSAALVAAQMEDRMSYPLLKAWHKMMADAAEEMDLGYLTRTQLPHKTPNTDKLATDIARNVQLEINARQIGRQSDQPNYIKEFANQLGDFNNGLFDLQLKHNVDGIKPNNRMNHYMKQSWRDGTFLDNIADKEIGEEGMIQLFEAGVRNRAGLDMSPEKARAYAEAIVANKKNALAQPVRESYRIGDGLIEDAPDQLADVLSTLRRRLGDTDEAVRMADEITDILGALDNGGPGYTNSRMIHVDLDTTINYNGRELNMLDLMDSNILGQALTYNREATGRAAISQATNGLIKSDADMDSFLRAASLQAIDSGTYLNTADIRNTYRSMVGQPLDGALPQDARRIRDGVALFGMNGLGESQLAEMGLALNRGAAALVASGQFISKTKGAVNKKFRGFELTEKQLNDKQFLDDMTEMSALYEDMHIVANNDTHFDVRQANAQVNPLSKIVHTATGGKYQPYMKYLQGRHTGYGAIRTMEEQIAMGGVVQDLARHLIGDRKSFTSESRFKDVGLMKSDGSSILSKYIDDGTVLLDGDHITNLNIRNWSPEDKNSFGVALRRHAGQQVQMGYAGELSPAMVRPDVAFLMQFKTYPLMAAEKQQGRNIKYADKEAAMGMVLNAMSSGMARAIRYASMAQALPVEDRAEYYERKLENLGSDTFMYMGSAGALFPLGEIVGAAGIDNPFSDSRDDFTGLVPAVNWMESYVQGAKSAGNVATGQGTDRDMYNMQAGAPLGTVLQMNLIMGVVRDLMAEDSDQGDQQ